MKNEILNSDKMEQMYFDKELLLDDMSKQDLAVLLTGLVDNAENKNEYDLLDECFTEMQKFNDFPINPNDKEILFHRIENKIETLEKEA